MPTSACARHVCRVATSFNRVLARNRITTNRAPTCDRRRAATRARRYGYYQQDADTFAKWKVDYVKFDGCDQPEGHTAKELTCNMSEALLKTGTDFWFNFHCWQVSSYRRRFI